MTVRSSQPDPRTPRPLSNWVIAAGALIVLAVAVMIWFVLLRRYGGQGAQVQLDAIRTAGTLVIGTGGAVALLLTARRQRYTELTLVHTTRDATERRITELYTKAADQLGSDQAPVRLAGLYALERLAHSTVEHRQTMVDVICAYLCMPYRTPPQSSASALGWSYRSPGPARRRRARTLTAQVAHPTSTSQGSRQEHAQQEQQVRLTAQNILLRNLAVAGGSRPVIRPRPPDKFPAWPEIRLRLTGALFLAFDMSWCQLHHCDFTRSQFTGGADFSDAEFIHRAYFNNARFAGKADFSSVDFNRMAGFEGVEFTGSADFRRARFTGGAYFEGARFIGKADFRGAHFTPFISNTLWNATIGGRGTAYFLGAQFTGSADFEGARFADGAYFEGTRFIGRADFRGAQFTSFISNTSWNTTIEGHDTVSFLGAQFTSGADFGGAQFTGKVDFGGARVASAAEPNSVWPPGWTTRPAKPDNGEDPAFRYLTKVEEAPVT